MTQLCLTTYNFPSFTHTTGMTHVLDFGRCKPRERGEIVRPKNGWHHPGNGSGTELAAFLTVKAARPQTGFCKISTLPANKYN